MSGVHSFSDGGELRFAFCRGIWKAKCCLLTVTVSLSQYDCCCIGGGKVLLGTFLSCTSVSQNLSSLISGQYQDTEIPSATELGEKKTASQEAWL